MPRSLPALSAMWMFAAAALPAAGLELVEVVKRVENSVVRVDTDSGFGSGVVIDDRGLILTNYHVVEDATRAEITLRSGQRFMARGFVAVDQGRDLALLKTAPLGRSLAIRVAEQMPQVGEKVAAFGNPKGYSFTTSEGIVAAIRTGQDVIDAIAEAYNLLGYAVDATWIQTTAPISGGNSGGPLVNMNAELVGINTWGDTRGQNLNFAITLPDIKPMLKAHDVDERAQPLASLPRRRARHIPSSNDDPEQFSLELPTGRVFSFDIFKTTPYEWERAAKPDEDNLVKIAHANGVTYAAAYQQRGVLHGLTVAQYDNRKPMVYANYVDGKRHGLLKTWNEAGEPVLFAQYLRGRRHGFCCLFIKDHLVMVAQHENDRLKYCQLMSNLAPLAGFSSPEEAAKDARASELLNRLADVETMLTRNEVEFRKQVREFELDRRQELASQLGPEKRRRISERGRQRTEQTLQFFRELERQATGR